MIKIRLARVGRKNRAYYRVVATPHTAPSKSGYLEVIGSYDPLSKKLEVDKELLEKWLDNGAQPSTTLHNILVKNKLVKEKAIKVSREDKATEKDDKKEKKEEKKKEEPKQEKKA